MQILPQALDKHFITKFEHINWAKVSIVLCALIAGWAFLQNIVPEPYHDIMFGVLSFVSTFIAAILKANKEVV
jgi:hypothetical protein